MYHANGYEGPNLSAPHFSTDWLLTRLADGVQRFARIFTLVFIVVMSPVRQAEVPD